MVSGSRQVDDLADDPVAEYIRTFMEWRLRYGIEDSCMQELHAAVLAERERLALTDVQRAQLLALADRIVREQQLDAGDAAAYPLWNSFKVSRISDLANAHHPHGQESGVAMRNGFDSRTSTNRRRSLALDCAQTIR